MSFFSDEMESFDQSDEAVEQVLEEVEESSIEESIPEAQKRIKIANYFLALIEGGFFGNDDSEAAKFVESEIMEYAKERLEVFLGMKQEKVRPVPIQLPFNENEVMALKKLAEMVLKKQPSTESKPEIKQHVVSTPTPVQTQPPKVVPAVLTPIPKSNKGKPTKTPPKKKLAKSQNSDKIEDNVIFEEDGKKYKWLTVAATGKREKIEVKEQVTSNRAIPTPPPVMGGPIDPTYHQAANNSMASAQGLNTGAILNLLTSHHLEKA